MHFRKLTQKIISYRHFKKIENESFMNSLQSALNPIKPGGSIFASGKFKFELFLNGWWYEPETL